MPFQHFDEGGGRLWRRGTNLDGRGERRTCLDARRFGRADRACEVGRGVGARHYLVGEPHTQFPVNAIRRHPLFRALRVDKLNLTALEATLRLYLDRDRLFKELPTLRMISMSLDECEQRALALATKLKAIPKLSVEVLDDSSEFGGGSVPTQQIPTKVVALTHPKRSLEALADGLRAGDPPVFCRVQRDRCLLDVRTLQEGDDEEIAASLRHTFNA